MRNDDVDPVDGILRDALSADRATTIRLASQALAAGRPVGRPIIPALIAFTAIVAAAIGVTRHATSEPPIVIRGEGDTIVIETGSGRNKTTEVMHADAPRGGVIIIRQGGDS